MRTVLLIALLAAIAAGAVVLWTAQDDLEGHPAVARRRSVPPPPVPGVLPVSPSGPSETSVILIVNATTTVPELTRSTVEQIYLGRRKEWDDGTPVVVVMPGGGSETAREFLAVFLRRTPQQYRGYWRKEILAGAAEVPREFADAAQLVEYVASTPGAIGVVAEPPGEPGVSIATVADVTTKALVPDARVETAAPADAAGDETTDTTEPDGTGRDGTGQFEDAPTGR